MGNSRALFSIVCLCCLFAVVWVFDQDYSESMTLAQAIAEQAHIRSIAGQ